MAGEPVSMRAVVVTPFTWIGVVTVSPSPDLGLTDRVCIIHLLLTGLCFRFHCQSFVTHAVQLLLFRQAWSMDRHEPCALSVHSCSTSFCSSQFRSSQLTFISYLFWSFASKIHLTCLLKWSFDWVCFVLSSLGCCLETLLLLTPCFWPPRSGPSALADPSRLPCLHLWFAVQDEVR